MPILIENLQNTAALDLHMIEQHIERMLEIAGYKELVVSIRLTDNKEIQTLNKQFRGKNAPTDILSFPFYPELRAGERLMLSEDDEPELGDIAISVERAQKDAQELGVPFEQHLTRLLAHGIAHLLGYDHETDGEYQQMAAFEKKLLA